jgi:outer membrane protein
LGIVLDKTTNNVLFLDKKYDYTDAVLSLLVKNLPKADETKNNALPGEIIRDKTEELRKEK